MAYEKDKEHKETNNRLQMAWIQMWLEETEFQHGRVMFCYARACLYPYPRPRHEVWHDSIHSISSSETLEVAKGNNLQWMFFSKAS